MCVCILSKHVGSKKALTCSQILPEMEGPKKPCPWRKLVLEEVWGWCWVYLKILLLSTQREKKGAHVSPNPVKVMHHPICTTTCSAFACLWNICMHAPAMTRKQAPLSIMAFLCAEEDVIIMVLWILAATMPAGQACGCGPAMHATCRQIYTNSCYLPIPISGGGDSSSKPSLHPLWDFFPLPIELNELVKLGAN